MRLFCRASLWQLNRQLARVGSRETWLLAVILAGAVALAQWGLIQLTGWQEWRSVDQQLEQRNQQVTQLENELRELERQQENPRQQELQVQIQRLERDIQRIDTAIASVTDDLVSPDNMVRVLRRLLDAESGLTLVRLQTLPVATTQGTAGGELEGTQIYRHAITMELEGSFNAVARYLDAVESSEWTLYWQDLHYRMDTYPTGRLVLTLYTLSSEEGWLNV